MPHAGSAIECYYTVDIYSIFCKLYSYYNRNTVVGIVDDVEYYRKLKPTITSHI